MSHSQHSLKREVSESLQLEEEMNLKEEYKINHKSQY